MKKKKSYFGILLLTLSLLTWWYGMNLIVSSSLHLDIGLSMSHGSWTDMTVKVYIDDISIYFLSTILLVSSCVLTYSGCYMGNSQYNYFISILFMFILSMLILSVSGSLFISILSWDLLGVTSVFLILYFETWKSLKSSLVTFMVNRVGDMFMMFSLMMTQSMNPGLSSWQFSALLLVCISTKSAQIPFSLWLPLAMQAPTPVSSLVHSSTLVTAGVYLMIRYNSMIPSQVMSIALLLGSASLLYSGVMATLESDLKKLIAYSTLSHISLIMISISQGLVSAGMLHLMAHAFFKSMLFMVAGWVIHGSGDSQDIRFLELSWSSNPLLSSFLFISLASMAGLPLSSGFCSKEYIVTSNLSGMTLTPFFMITLMGVSLCAAYSLRLGLTISKFTSNNSNKCCNSMPLSVSLPLLVGSGMSMIYGYWFMTFNLGAPKEDLSIYSDFMIKISLISSLLTGLVWGMIGSVYSPGSSMTKSQIFMSSWAESLSPSLEVLIHRSSLMDLSGWTDNLFSQINVLSNLSSSKEQSSLYSALKVWLILSIVVYMLS
nr:NADH dehydrogenase subunit 5 [Linognathus vituli]